MSVKEKFRVWLKRAKVSLLILDERREGKVFCLWVVSYPVSLFRNLQNSLRKLAYQNLYLFLYLWIYKRKQQTLILCEIIDAKQKAVTLYSVLTFSPNKWLWYNNNSTKRRRRNLRRMFSYVFCVEFIYFEKMRKLQSVHHKSKQIKTQFDHPKHVEGDDGSKRVRIIKGCSTRTNFVDQFTQWNQLTHFDA